MSERGGRRELPLLGEWATLTVPEIITQADLYQTCTGGLACVRVLLLDVEKRGMRTTARCASGAIDESPSAR